MRKDIAFMVASMCLLGSVLSPVPTAVAAEQGLVAHWDFDEGQGDLLHDRSGNGLDGKIVKAAWAQTPAGSALRFQAAGDHVDFGKPPALSLTGDMTIIAWVRLEAAPHPNGKTNWYIVDCEEYQKSGFMLRVDGGTGRLTFRSSQEGSEQTGFSEGSIENHRTYHAAVVRKAGSVTLYIDAERDITFWTRDPLPPSRSFRVSSALGQSFQGLIYSVRIYNRALTAREVAVDFSARAGRMGLKVQPGLSARLDATRGELIVEANLLRLGPLPARPGFVLSLRDGKGNVVHEMTEKIPPDAETASARVPTATLTAGPYEITAAVKNLEDGKSLGEPSSKKWYFPEVAQTLGAPPGRKVLNNLAVQLAETDALEAKPYQELALKNPRKGWVFVATEAAVGEDGSLTISVDGEKEDAVLRHRGDGPTRLETMRFLPAGQHRLRVWAEEDKNGTMPALRRVVIRAVPAMMYCTYPARAHSGYGSYDFEFLAKDVLPNINTIIGSGKSLPEQREWQERGGQWLLEQNIPTVFRDLYNQKDMPDAVTGDYAFNYWTTSEGFTNPYLDGLVGDEFVYGRGHQDFPGYAEAIKRIAADKRFKGKAVHAWCSQNMYLPGPARDFSRTVIEAGYKIIWMQYLGEQPTEEAARNHIGTRFGREVLCWEEAFPGAQKDLIASVGILGAPPETNNVDPQVDCKVFLDMQFQFLATAPKCFGLYGVMVYKSTYADEESVRWVGRLFRHYCIEGNTDLLSERYGFKYRLDYTQNGDFDDGLAGWTVVAAEEGSVKSGRIDRLGTLLGRYGVDGPGNHFLWMKRCANAPNRVSQEIRNLEPGRLYSMKMIAADHGDLSQGLTEKKRLSLAVRLDGVDVILEKSFVSEICGIYRVGVFSGKPPHG